MKEKTVFVCQQCGQSFSKWAGRCQDCGEWNSIVEERSVTAKSGKSRIITAAQDRPLKLTEIPEESGNRVPSGISELDNVLGGGIVPGSALLIGGEPGIGKSTLLLQIAERMAAQGLPVLYASGEESASQIAIRARRLGATSEKVHVLSETSLEAIKNHIDKEKPALLIVDSIQTIYSGLLESQPGSVGQLRECAYQLIGMAKSSGMSTFLVGHVTKDGAIAGPKVLEHMVDVVLYFEGSTSMNFRLLRTIKNRFGSTNELGVFEMSTEGLKPVKNPSELFLSERPEMTPGSVIVASQEGTRPFLVEVQALAAHSGLTIPRRTALGVDPNRLSLLVAILERRGGFRLSDQDVYVNVAGGLRIQETAIDLGVLAALVSSYSGKPVAKDSVFFGEAGLGGEIRNVSYPLVRLKEAARIGLKRAYLPKKIAKDLAKETSLELIPIGHVQELADFI